MQHGRALLKAWLGRTKLRQNELAQQLAVNEPYLSNILTGVRRRPSLEIMIRIERLTGVPVSSWADNRDGETDEPSANTADSTQLTER